MLERAAFTFTHSQKKGILLLVLILLVALCALISFNYLSAQKPYTHAGFDQNFAQPVTVQDSSFRLDINLADSAAWSSLEGVSPYLSRRIVRYRQKIGGFQDVEQLTKVYGLSPKTFERIKPFLYYNRFSAPISQKKAIPKATRASKKTYPKLDINIATAEDFEQLPGIGKTLSKRIVKYRSAIGGFSDIEELNRVYYLEPSTFKAIKPYLFLDVPSSIFAEEPNEQRQDLETYFAEANNGNKEEIEGPSRGEKTFISQVKVPSTSPKLSLGQSRGPVINLNTADSASLSLLPGLESRLVMRIVKYRRLLGFFYSVDQLKQVYGLSPQIFEQIKPYLKVEGIDKLPRKDLNIAFARNLAFYPFVDKTIAEAIVSERKSLGHFKSWEEVLAVPGVTSEILRKLRIYFEI